MLVGMSRKVQNPEVEEIRLWEKTRNCQSASRDLPSRGLPFGDEFVGVSIPGALPSDSTRRGSHRSIITETWLKGQAKLNLIPSTIYNHHTVSWHLLQGPAGLSFGNRRDH